MSKILSIVIPVYNVEQYLPRCLNSCISQDISPDDYEIIIVVDGSPDNSLSIAKKYEERNANITVINQENQGLSVARNNGLKRARGEFVWFIDSDDWIETNCLHLITQKLVSEHPDLLQIGFQFAYDNTQLNKVSNRGLLEKTVTGKEAMRMTMVPSPAQFTICRRDFLNKNGLRFFPGIYHEDSEFKPRALFYAEKYASLNGIVYYYYQRDRGSIMSSFNKKRGLDLLLVAEHLSTFIDEKCIEGVLKNHYCLWISMVLNQMLKGLRELDNEDVNEVKEALLGKKSLFGRMMQSTRIVHRIEGFLFLINNRVAFTFFGI